MFGPNINRLIPISRGFPLHFGGRWGRETSCLTHLLDLDVIKITVLKIARLSTSLLLCQLKRIFWNLKWNFTSWALTVWITWVSATQGSCWLLELTFYCLEKISENTQEEHSQTSYLTFTMSLCESLWVRVVLFLFYGWGNRVSERPGDSPKFTWLVNGRAETRSLLVTFCSLFLALCFLLSMLFMSVQTIGRVICFTQHWWKRYISQAINL